MDLLTYGNTLKIQILEKVHQLNMTWWHSNIAQTDLVEHLKDKISIKNFWTLVGLLDLFINYI